MNELKITSYEQLKNELNIELGKAANSFVRIGFILKLARDEDVLEGSGYTNVNDFAEKEFGLDKTQVSRFIRINDRFAIGGYSEHLKLGYEEYGSAKLSLMLTLPDELNEEISPEYSKADIQAIKEEYDEEQKITPIEVALEKPAEDMPDDFIEAVVKELNDEHPESIEYVHKYHDMAKKMGIRYSVDDIREAYMPDGECTKIIRISGQGRFTVNFKSTGITVVNMRAPEEKSPISWEEFLELVLKDEETRSFAVEKTENTKAETKSKPKKVEKSKVAPVQPKESVQKKADSVQKEAESVAKEAESVAQDEKTEEIEKVEVEIVSEGMNPPEQQAGDLTGGRKQISDELDKIKKYIAAREPWSYIQDKLRGVIREINKIILQEET